MAIIGRRVTIDLRVPKRNAKALYISTIARASRRLQRIEMRDLDRDLRTRIDERRRVLEEFAMAIVSPPMTRIRHTVPRADAELLREELLDVYGAMHPDGIDDALDADLSEVAALTAAHVGQSRQVDRGYANV